MKNYSYIGISFIILVFGIWSVPKIVDKFTNKELSYILDANKDLKKIPDFSFINQENDIIQIIGGLQGIINTCLDIKSDSLLMIEDEDDEIIRNEKIKKNEQNKNGGIFNSIFGGGESTGYFASDSF